MSQPLRVLQQEQLSSEATQLAAQHDLGAATGDYKVVLNKEKRTYIIMGIIGAIGLFALSGVFLVPTANFSITVGLLCIAFALLCLGMAIRYGTYPIRYKTWHIYTCDNGFIFSKEGKAEVFSWEQIESLWHRVTQHKSYGMNIGMTHKYTVRRTDGTTVILDDKFENVDKLGDIINVAVIKVKMPQGLAALSRGELINFGPISISQQGITKGKELLPWDQARAVDVSGGYFIVNRHKQMLSWAHIEVYNIPNALLLITLIRNLHTLPENGKGNGAQKS